MITKVYFLSQLFLLSMRYGWIKTEWFSKLLIVRDFYILCLIRAYTWSIDPFFLAVKKDSFSVHFQQKYHKHIKQKIFLGLVKYAKNWKCKLRPQIKFCLVKNLILFSFYRNKYYDILIKLHLTRVYAK